VAQPEAMAIARPRLHLTSEDNYVHRGTIKPTPIPWLTVLLNIPPPDIVEKLRSCALIGRV